jgi:hypothetical protein
MATMAFACSAGVTGGSRGAESESGFMARSRFQIKKGQPKKRLAHDTPG